MLQHITAPDAPVPGGPYSHAVAIGDLVFLSGQRPVDPATGALPEGLSAQAHQVFGNLRAVLAECGADFTHVVKFQVYLADISDFDAFNAIYRHYVPAPFPARTTVATSLRGILIEVDAVAHCPMRGRQDQ